jgi:hypothetical protein
MSASLEEVAIRVARVVGEEDCVLIGGLAVAAWGYVRATADVDFVARDLRAAHERLHADGLAVEWGRGAFSLLRGKIDDVVFDVLPALVPIQWEKARTVSFGPGRRLRVVDLEGLIRLKLKAAGPQDLMDVAALVSRHSDMRERARELSVAYQIREKLDLWLADPRLTAPLAPSTAPARGPRRTARGDAKKKTARRKSRRR